jgi:hypothetical protein
MPIKRCLAWLSYLWAAYALLLFGVLLFQYLGGHFSAGQEGSTTLYNLLSLVLPTSALILAAWWATDSSGRVARRVVDKGYFWMAWFVSLFYLSILLVALLAQPLITTDAAGYTTNLHLAMSIFQTFVSAAVGVFFVKAREET